MKRVKVNTKPIVVNDKDVNRIVFLIFFAIKKDKKDAMNKRLLGRLLTTVSKKYNTIEKLDKVTDENYIIDYNAAFTSNETYNILMFKCSVPRDGLIEEYSLENALNVLHEMIFNPYIENGSFNKDSFNYEKDFLLQKESDFPSSINAFAYNEFSKFVDPEEKYGFSHETYIKLLKETTPEGLAKFYDKLIKNNNYFSIIAGNVVNDDKVLNTFNKIFKQDYKEMVYNFEFFDIYKEDGYEEKVIKTDYNQSMVMIRYTFKDYKKSDYFKFKLLIDLVDSDENDLMFNKLRIKNQIIYTYNLMKDAFSGEIVVVLYLDKEDINLGKKLVNEVFDTIKDKDYFEECKKRTMRAMKYDLLSNQDKVLKGMEDAMDKLLAYKPGFKKYIKKIETLTYEDVMDLLNRMSNTKTLIIESGDDHE